MIRLRWLIMFMLLCISILSVNARSEYPVSASVHNLVLPGDKVSVTDIYPIEFSKAIWGKLTLRSSDLISKMDSSSARSNAKLNVRIASSNSNIESNLEILDKIAQNPIDEAPDSGAERCLKILYDQAVDREKETNYMNVSHNYDANRNISLLYEGEKNPNANFDLRIASSNANLKSNLKFLGNEILSPVVVGGSDTDTGHYLKALYEQDAYKGKANDYAHADQNYENVGINIRYLYESSKIPNANSDIRIDSSNVNTGHNQKNPSKRSELSDSYNKLGSNLNYIFKSSEGEPGSEAKAVKNTMANLNYLVQLNQSTLQPYVQPKSAGKSDSHSQDGNSLHEDGYGRKKYAIIVGINDYSYTRSLGTSVNDANEVEKVLKKYGYEIIKLTDDTDIKPTKYNILNGALAEIGLKQGEGNIIFYFSGHAEKDDKSNIYLLPQDANGNFSTYINGEELKRCFKDLKNLAVIIDACNSGGLNYNAEDGQLILTSSKGDEPSNEDWLGPFSMFTHQLCDAINEEGKFGRKISLQRCFDIARTNTIRLSRSYLLYQTPMIIDKTGGVYYLN